MCNYHVFGHYSYVFWGRESIVIGYFSIKPPQTRFLPLFTTFRTTAEPKIIEIQIYSYHTILGLNSYVPDDHKSIKSGLKFIRLSCVPLVPLFATFRATAEHKIIQMLIYDFPKCTIMMCLGIIPMFFDTENRLQ